MSRGDRKGYGNGTEECYDCGREMYRIQMTRREKREGVEGSKAVLVCPSCDRDHYGIPGVPGM